MINPVLHNDDAARPFIYELPKPWAHARRILGLGRDYDPVRSPFDLGRRRPNFDLKVLTAIGSLDRQTIELPPRTKINRAPAPIKHPAM
jgi:hypothetical protein